MAKILARNIPFQSEYVPAGTVVDVVAVNYINGGTCIRLIDSATQEPLLTASVWLMETGLLPKHQFFCKNYSENSGVPEGLEQASIAELITRDMDDDYIPIMALTGECLIAFNS